MTFRTRTSTLPQNALVAPSGQTQRSVVPLNNSMNDSMTGRIDLTLPSTLATVDRMEQESERFALDHGFNEDDAANVAMAAREAAVNAVMHGNSYSSTKQVRVSLQSDDAALTISIQDEGGGFNAALLPDPLLPENILRSSGRGIFLMRALMDEVNFRQLNPGTELTMTKHRTAGTELK